MIEIEAVSRVYEGRAAVDEVSLQVREGEILVLVGASGAGKSTLLRMINRLVEPTSGVIRLAGQDISAQPAHLLRRRIGYAIQGDGLFPHRSVAQNIATVPRLLGWSAGEIAARVDELLAMFGLEPGEFRDRMPNALSGGQQQRVGVARALAARPEILLMDEPFGALDPVSRAKAQADLRAIQAQLGTTIVMVTHDIDEAIWLADRVGVMEGGRLVQLAAPERLLRAPASAGVAALTGSHERPFRLLALRAVVELRQDGQAEGPPIAPDMSLRDALAQCLWQGREALALEGGGIVTRAALIAQAAGGRGS